jgi:chaperone required for assembly of F1-ATPase
MSDGERGPMQAAQAAMRPPVLRRFYKRAEVAAAEGAGFAITLDGRATRTPGKRLVIAPTLAIAELIAAEWVGQGEAIEPQSMPATRLANSAIDGVANASAETQAEIAKYAAADLVCYRAEAPDALVELQAEAFDPVFAWARETLGARFVAAVGLTHVAQPDAALAAARAAVEAYSEPFAVAALHVMTSLTGSLLIALMTAKGASTAEAAWRAAHVDEDFQIGRWGEDDEAKRRRAARWRDFEAAAQVMARL